MEAAESAEPSAKRFAVEGAAVTVAELDAILAAKLRKRLAKTVEKRSLSRPISARRIDQEIVAETVATFGCLKFLVNNAARS